MTTSALGSLTFGHLHYLSFSFVYQKLLHILCTVISLVLPPLSIQLFLLFVSDVHMSFSVAKDPSVLVASSSLASSIFLSPKPPVPAFVIMSSQGTSSTSSLSRCSVGGNVSGGAGHVAGNVPSPDPGSTAGTSIEVDESSAATGTSVWDLDHVQKAGDHKGNQTWKCLWCNLTFRQWNATKVLYHLAKINGRDVRVCQAKHDPKSKELYQSMLQDKDRMNSGKQARAAKFDSLVAEGQQSLAVMFEAGRKRLSNGGGGTVTNSVTTDTTRPRVFASEFTVEASTASQLTMAIADFVHSSGLPFSVTQGAYFQNILKFARGVSSTYKPPNRNALSDSLLKISYNRRMEK